MWFRDTRRDSKLVGLPVAALLATTVLMFGDMTPSQVAPRRPSPDLVRSVAETSAIHRAARARQYAVLIRRQYMVNTMYVLGPGEDAGRLGLKRGPV